MSCTFLMPRSEWNKELCLLRNVRLQAVQIGLVMNTDRTADIDPNPSPTSAGHFPSISPISNFWPVKCFLANSIWWPLVFFSKMLDHRYKKKPQKIRETRENRNLIYQNRKIAEHWLVQRVHRQETGSITTSPQMRRTNYVLNLG